MSINGAVEVADHRKADSAVFNLEPLDMQPEKFSGRRLPNINEEWSCPGGSDVRNFTLKEIAEIFYDIQSTNAEMVETTLN